MKFKLDENLGTRTLCLFEEAGYDVQTIRRESLQGTSDQHLYQACCTEQRCLVTLDLDFSDVIRFPPDKSGGIAVIRLPRTPTLSLLEKLVRQFLQAISQTPIEKRLWIVEIGRIRIHQTNADDWS
jgi:predicted nuclease of predicted toxin-antitoxin system